MDDTFLRVNGKAGCALTGGKIWGTMVGRFFEQMYAVHEIVNVVYCFSLAASYFVLYCIFQRHGFRINKDFLVIDALTQLKYCKLFYVNMANMMSAL
jgi:hypothetical protein